MLRALLLEDSPQDVEIIRELLVDAGFDLAIDCTAVEKEFISLLRSRTYDIILADFKLPGFDGFAALRWSMEICPHVPFICVSGTIGEDVAVDLLKHGAVDYVLKDRLKKLPTAINRALGEVKEKEARRKVETTLRESEEKFRSLFESSQDAIMIMEPPSWKFTSGNPATVKMFRAKNEEEFVSRTPGELSPDRQPDGRASAEKSKEMIETAMREGFHFFEWTHRRIGGENFSADVLLTRMEQNGKLILEATVRDITERKQAEKRINLLAHTVKSIAECVSITDMNDTIVFVNHAFLTTYGYAEHEILGKNINVVRSPNNPPNLVSGIHDAARDAGWHGELMNRAKDGREFPVSLSTSLVRDDNRRAVALVGVASDITERKRTEEQLSKSEEKYRGIFENVQDVYYETALDGTILELSPSLEIISKGQYHRDELIGELMYDFYSIAGGRQTLLALLQERGSVTDHEIVLKNRDGSQVPCSISAKIQFDVQGTPLKIIGSMRDITERKRAEEALTYERNLLKALTDNIPDYIYFKDKESRFLRISRSLANIFGLDDPSQAVGKTDFDFFAEEHARSAFEDEQKMLKSGIVIVGLEEKEWWPDGRQTWVSTTKAPLKDAQGEIIGTIGISRDITKRKRAEEERQRLITAFEQTAEAILVTDPRGIIQYVNPAIEQITGYQRSDVIGQNPRILKSGRQNAEFYQELWNTISKGRRWSGRFINKKKDGTLFTDETSISPVVGENGAIISYVGVKRDITSEITLELQLIQAQKLESIGTLASGIAHDFNNILGIILGYATLLERDPSTIPQSVAFIIAAVNRGAGLVRQILTFARKGDVLFIPVQMSEMIEEIVKMLRETFPRTIEFSLELGPDVPLVTADATQVHQVLLNLCVNARDAMPDGGTLTLMTKVINGRSLSEIFPEIPNENFVHVSVIDTGIGMDEKTRARIFDPFFTTKEKGKGTGLGLSVVYGVMREHHGYVHVESVPGKGTGFDLYFPIVRVGGVEVSEKPIEQRRFLGGRETLLVVEDEEALIAMIKVTFEANGYCVLQAMDGLQALEVYRAHRGEIALVLTDMGMPKITGEQLFFELRKLNPAVKVVMASGYLEANARSEILKAGVKSFVQKPYLPDELLKTVREILDQHL